MKQLFFVSAIFAPLGVATPALAAEDRPATEIVTACAPCHGADGVAREAEVPDLAGQHNVYLFNQLRNFKSGHRPHAEMKAMARGLSTEEMQSIADYYSHMTR